MIGVDSSTVLAIGNSIDHESFAWGNLSNKFKYAIPFIQGSKNLAYKENFKILIDFLCKEIPDVKHAISDRYFSFYQVERIIINRFYNSVRIYFLNRDACDGFLPDSRLTSILLISIVRNLMRSFYLSESENLCLNQYYR